MQSSPHRNGLVLFGPFEVDLQQVVLRRRGIPSRGAGTRSSSVARRSRAAGNGLRSCVPLPVNSRRSGRAAFCAFDRLSWHGGEPCAVARRESRGRRLEWGKAGQFRYLRDDAALRRSGSSDGRSAPGYQPHLVSRRPHGRVPASSTGGIGFSWREPRLFPSLCKLSPNSYWFPAAGGPEHKQRARDTHCECCESSNGYGNNSPQRSDFGNRAGPASGIFPAN
jgi:hypothetical protein